MEIVVNTTGTAIKRADSNFVVETLDGCQKIPAEGVSAIHLCKGAQIASDAVMLAIEREIDVLFVGKGGDVAGRVWSHRYGSISSIRKGQLLFTQGADAVQWIEEVLAYKVSNQQALLLMLDSDDPAVLTEKTRAINRLESYRTKIASLGGEYLSDMASTLRGWEGMASRIYFATINQFLPEPYRYEGRSQHPAMDVFNAMLNYGYGILYARIESALIRVGIDPYIGVLHRDEYNRPVLVYDIIERYRIWVEYVVCMLAMQGVITAECYSIHDDGSCWLEPLGRRILIQSLNDYLEETIEVDGNIRSRQYQIFLYVQQLAQIFKELQS